MNKNHKYLHDFEISWFSKEKRNHRFCCRIKHKPTQITAIGQSYKNYLNNKKEALEKIFKNPFVTLFYQ